MKRVTPLLALLAIITQVNAQPESDLLFSEYVEGKGNNRALEIYNPSDRTIDLSNYRITRYEDGAHEVSGNYSTQLQGELPPGETFVLVNGQTTGTEASPACDPALQNLADQLDASYPAPTYMDGNDAIALEKTDGTLIDLIGKIGQDPGSGWYDQDSTSFMALEYDSLAWTKDHTMIRKPFVREGNRFNYGETPDVPQHFNPANEWDTLPVGTWTDLGNHTYYTSAIPPSLQQDKFSVYPNPAPSNNFYIRASKRVHEIEIMTLLGKSIYKKTKAHPAKKLHINLTQSRNGIFLIKLRFTDNSYAVSKVLLAGKS